MCFQSLACTSWTYYFIWINVFKVSLTETVIFVFLFTYDPNVNICVGVRWLFRKREIAKYYLKKEPTPLQLAEEFKGIRNDKSDKATKQREIFLDLSKRYKKEKISR